MMNKRRNNRGFTIVELMIASTVFGTVLLLATYGLLEIGRAYYKGAAISRTQETARVIMNNVSESIQFNHGAMDVSGTDDIYCLGNKLYNFSNASVMREEDSPGLLTHPVEEGCADSGNTFDSSATTTELLATRTRLAKFNIDEVSGSNAYRVTVRVITGEDEYLDTFDGETVCANERESTTYCATAELTTVVRRRVQ